MYFFIFLQIEHVFDKSIEHVLTVLPPATKYSIDFYVQYKLQ